MKIKLLSLAICALLICPMTLLAQGKWEITPQSEKAVEDGLKWLAVNQGPKGNWESKHMGLVALGALAFMSAGHAPGRGQYGDNVKLALDYIINNARPSGLLNISEANRDMYNHGLSTFVLTQAYGMSEDERIGVALDKALDLIIDVQCDDGGWDYRAKRQAKGHDLSLVVTQAKALRGAMDVGLDLPPETIEKAIKSVRRYYRPSGKPDGKGHLYSKTGDPLANQPGQFTYNGSKATLAMAAAGVVCLQEFGKYGDFRIYRSMDVIEREIKRLRGKKSRDHNLPLDAYTLYYVSQALYQVGKKPWRENYATLRDAVVVKQNKSESPKEFGSWQAGKHVSGTDGKLFGTAVGVFALSVPNRYLPILQEGHTEKGQDEATD